jgi:hypothetical protein
LIEISKMKTRSLAVQSFAPYSESDDFSAMMQTGRFQITAEMLEALNPDKDPLQPASVDSLNKGDWVEIHQDKETIKAKLAWKAEDSSFYIFIDRNGKRVCEVDDDTLTRRLISGDISLVNSNGLSTGKTQFSITHSLT